MDRLGDLLLEYTRPLAPADFVPQPEPFVGGRCVTADETIDQGPTAAKAGISASPD